ncbi:dinitrogenase iron-molybdenum cofactor biosynthesis protein [Candidatus Sulfidibacterium hydrothermale]|uniref:NifB/NifX family molybdenum-iron cluster-binding protein n=1 Tax=Candidatus Sulfidibacterium hydrothermale TaxID=2875962 RepID=UPI001F0B4EA3|nr:NifB/NifX family molybdenum-iron cluster-binding protein [Candidatus Sulfidibacterium hydrothermale]UBM62902.1 dinitrogenase iron-molybdenum cofactor biosynthesis protein [Candidatus Sulfidibacterium hydrothermale]
MEIIAAFSTDDGKTYVDKHSGDARYFDLYKITPDGSQFLKRVINPPKEEKRHADPEKAKGIAQLLKKEGVQVVVSKVFGPNIKRIRKQFVCIMMNDPEIAQSLSVLQQKTDLILSEWKAGEDRNVLNFKK